MAQDKIRISDITYRYPRQEDPALQQVSLRLPPGEVLAVMGPTGAGKTTLVSLLNGLIPQYFEGQFSGEVSIGALSIRQHRIQDLVEQVGLVLQDPETQIFGITVLEDTAFGPSNLGYPREEILARVQEALQTVRLGGYEERATAHLSGGEKQRLAIAGVLAMRPEVLVLDEPTSELDPAGRAEVFEAVEHLRAERQTTVVLVEHEAEEVLRLASKLAVLRDGRVVWFGDPRQLFQDVALTRDLQLCPPAMAELGQRLQARGVLAADDLPLTVPEAEQALRAVLADHRLEAGQPSQSRSVNESGPPIIATRDLAHVYAGGIQALSGVNLRINPGEFVAIVGQNGAGKSTLVKHFNGLLKPTTGQVIVNQKDTRNCDVQELARQVGYVFQNPDHQIFSTSVGEEIGFGLANLGLDEAERERRIQAALDFVGLAEKRGRHPFTLSKGERQAVAVASILAIAPAVIVIDEPTTGLDCVGAEQMMALISGLHREGHTIIMITHNMKLVAKYSERVVLMNAGRVLLDGPPEAVFADSQALQESYLEAPPVAQLARRLADLGCPPGILTTEHMVEVLATALC